MSAALITSLAYGRRVGLHVAVDALDAVTAVLPFWWSTDDVEPEQTWEVTTPAAGERVVRDMELWVAEHAIDKVFVHAGVVALDGRALLLPGRSFAGKSTLTAALVRAGAEYGSDEYAVLRPDGRVSAYPRRLALRTPTGVERVSAADLGGSTMSEPLPVAVVADLQYVVGATGQLETISAGAAALRLFANAVCASTRSTETLAAVTSAVTGAHCVSGTRTEAVDVTEELLGLLVRAEH